MSRGASEGGNSAGVVRVWLLGDFRVSVGSRTIGEDRWRRRKAVALVKLLALAPSHRMHRERVMHLLWPHLRGEAAANNLHRPLYVARRNIEPDPFTDEGSGRCTSHSCSASRTFRRSERTMMVPLRRFAVTRLYLDRAHRREEEAAFSAGSVQAVARICRRLEGIPLAIELAAAMTAALSVEQIEERLEDSLGLLTTGFRTADPRHRTLRATLE